MGCYLSVYFKKQPPKVFCFEKGVLRNFTKFTRKYLCQTLFFNKVAGMRPATLLKKRLWHRCFRVNFAKFLRQPFLQNTFGRLLLYSRKISWFECFINLTGHHTTNRSSLFKSGIGIIITHWGLTKIWQLTKIMTHLHDSHNFLNDVTHFVYLLIISPC